MPKDFPGLLFGRSGAIVVDRERSVDIDDSLDLIVVQELFKKFGGDV